MGLISNCMCVCVCETTHPWVEIILGREPMFSLDGRIIGDLKFFFRRLSTINGFLIRKTCSVIFKSSICLDQKGNFSRIPASILTAGWCLPADRVERRKARIGRGDAHRTHRKCGHENQHVFVGEPAREQKLQSGQAVPSSAGHPGDPGFVESSPRPCRYPPRPLGAARGGTPGPPQGPRGQGTCLWSHVWLVRG